MPDYIPIGIASSVAKSDSYSWLRTIEFAQQFELDLVQLYLNPIRINHDLAEISSINHTDLQTIVHLPDQTISDSLILKIFRQLSNISVLIQHEKNLDLSLLKHIENSTKSLGIENDNIEDLYSFMQLIKLSCSQKRNIIPVLDLPRFFHQHASGYTMAEIEQAILKINNYISSIGKSVILHLIDSVGTDGARQKWRPVFEGDLPLDKLLRNILKNTKIHSIILEYESYSMTRRSIENIRTFLKNYKYI